MIGASPSKSKLNLAALSGENETEEVKASIVEKWLALLETIYYKDENDQNIEK